MTETNQSPKRLFLSPPHLSGREMTFIQKAIDSNYIAPLGPQVDEFESEISRLTGGLKALALSSGTSAIHLALRCLDVGPGDLIIASTLTFIGSVSPVIYLGGELLFVDADPDSWNMSVPLLEEEIFRALKRGLLPKAVVVTDLYGQCADMDGINNICRPLGIPVVSDAAESLGATYKGRPAGSLGTVGIFSFNGNKIITTSGGGVLVSEDNELVERARYLSQQARDDAPHYEHSTVGFNYRMSNVLAALGLAQLEVLEERVQKKRHIFNYYRQALANVPGITFMPESSYGRSNRWLTVILIDQNEFGADREQVRLVLERENIESRPVWKPMHLQPVFKASPTEGGSGLALAKGRVCRVVGGRVAEDLFNRGLCLPSGTAMNHLDLDRIINAILRCRP